LESRGLLLLSEWSCVRAHFVENLSEGNITMSNECKVSRRGFLAGAIGTTLALSSKASAVEPPNMTTADVDRMMTELSNWGRWGKDDQMGTVNLVTAAKRKHAVSLAREGTVVSLSHAQSTVEAPDNKQPLTHVTHFGASAGVAYDSYNMFYHGNYYSHMDALCHMFWNGRAYNGNLPAIVTPDGASKLDITAFKEGVVTRGILMDIPRLKGVPYLEPELCIYGEDLDAAEKMAHVKVASGDALILRTGRWARRAEKGPWNTQTSSAGLHASSVRWLKQRDVAILASDSVSDVKPSRVEGLNDPIHKLVIVALGTPILDNLDLEELSETANRMNRWEFLLTAAPMVIPGGTGSPLNPLAIF
jgi:kynurenine formamidase